METSENLFRVLTHKKESLEKKNIFNQAHLSFWMLNEHKRILVVPKIHAVGPPVTVKIEYQSEATINN